MGPYVKRDIGGSDFWRQFTFMSRVTVSAKVGIDCGGVLTVRRCSMPSGPYQFLSLINPVPFVVLSKAATNETEQVRVEWHVTRFMVSSVGAALRRDEK